MPSPPTRPAPNTASGNRALYSNTTGSNNTASGHSALFSNTTGNNNIALGNSAGVNLTTGNNNIDIGNRGVAAEGNTIRIGDANQTRAFIAGIRGVTTGSADAIAVLIDSNGQLGTVSSSRRFKDDIADMDAASSALMKLRPVTFHYKTDQNPSGRTLQYGLIAEEVAEVYPGLVAHSADGQIETVMYQFLPPMLLNEVQKQQRTIEAQAAHFEAAVNALNVQNDQKDEQIRKLTAQVDALTRAVATARRPQAVASVIAATIGRPLAGARHRVQVAAHQHRGWPPNHRAAGGGHHRPPPNWGAPSRGRGPGGRRGGQLFVREGVRQDEGPRGSLWWGPVQRPSTLRSCERRSWLYTAGPRSGRRIGSTRSLSRVPFHDYTESCRLVSLDRAHHRCIDARAVSVLRHRRRATQSAHSGSGHSGGIRRIRLDLWWDCSRLALGTGGRVAFLLSAGLFYVAVLSSGVGNRSAWWPFVALALPGALLITSAFLRRADIGRSKP